MTDTTLTFADLFALVSGTPEDAVKAIDHFRNSSAETLTPSQTSTLLREAHRVHSGKDVLRPLCDAILYAGADLPGREPTRHGRAYLDAEREVTEAQAKLDAARHREKAILEAHSLLEAVNQRDDAQEIFNDIFRLMDVGTAGMIAIRFAEADEVRRSIG